MSRISLVLAGAVALGVSPALGAKDSRRSPIIVSPAPASPGQRPDAQAADPAARLSRARANLLALRAGHLSVAQLTSQELQDVIDFERLVSADPIGGPTEPRQQCVAEEVRRLGGKPSRLAWQVIALKCR